MNTTAIKSRGFAEYLVTIFLAFVFAWCYKSSPILITCGTIGIIAAGITLLKRLDYAVFFVAAILPFRDIHIVSAVYFKLLVILGLGLYNMLRQFISRHMHSTPTLRLFNKSLIFFAVVISMSLLKTAAAVYSTELMTPNTIKTIILSDVWQFFEGILLLYIVYYSLTTIRQIQQLLDICLVVSGIISLLGILQYVFEGPPSFLSILFDPEYTFSTRATSVFSNPNALGAFCSPMAAIAFVYLVIGTTSLWKKLWLIVPSLLLNLLALFLSFSRGAAIQTFMGILVTGYMYVRNQKLSRRTIIFLGIIGGIMLSTVWYYDFYMQQRLGSDKGAEYDRAMQWTKTVGDYQRKYVAIKAIQSFMQHPIFGIGYALFSGKKTAGFEYFGLNTHNQYLKIFAEMGLLGAIPFLLLLGIPLKTGIKMCETFGKQPASSPETSVTFLLLTGISSVLFGYFFADAASFIPVSGFLWIFAGAMLVIERCNSQESMQNR